LIRALDEGDGATLHEKRDEIRAALVELRRYREALLCSCCGRSVIGREPVCKRCHEGHLEERDLYDGMADDEASMGEGST
jgi:hypothetical protein